MRKSIGLGVVVIVCALGCHHHKNGAKAAPPAANNASATDPGLSAAQQELGGAPPATDTTAASDAPASGGGTEIDVSGSFALQGAAPDGKPYFGEASLRRVSAYCYRGTWKLQGGQPFEGVAFQDGDTLTVGWLTGGIEGHTFGVISYLIKEDANAADGDDDNNLDGDRYQVGQSVFGREVLVGGTTNFVGKYAISSASNPDGSTYTGTVNIGVSSGVYTFKWKYATASSMSVEGIGLRSGNILGAVYSDAPGYSLGQFHIGKQGGVLSGQWVQPGPKGQLSIGTETATRK